MKKISVVAFLRLSALTAWTFALLSLQTSQGQTTGWNQTAAGTTYDYNLSTNWVGGNINGIWDSSLTLAGGQTIRFGTNTLLTTGLNFGYVGGVDVTLAGSGDRTLTLGGNILVNTASTTRTINLGAGSGSNLNVDLGGVTRTFTVGSGRTLGFVNVISNGGIIASGGTINFSGANTYSGATTLNAGTISMNGQTGSSANSDFTLNGNATNTTTLAISGSTGGTTGTTRAKSVALNGVGSSNGAAMTVSGNATANNVETITNALTAAGGFSTVSVTPNAAGNTQLVAGSFARNAGSTMLIRGTNLGTTPIGTPTDGAVNIVFNSTTGLLNQAGSGTTVGIITGVYGDTAANGSGFGTTGGLLTYDATNGLRRLNTGSEYTAGIVDLQATSNNVRYVRVSGGASQDITLSAGTTTINSLSFDITGTGTNSGVTIGGAAGSTLKINSGVIYANQAVTTAAATDAMKITAPTLDLNGKEGVVLVATAGMNQGNTPGPLQIDSAITNGTGLTKAGSGQLILGGATANTYSGVTTVNAGVLRLAKTGGAFALPGDLVMNGGVLLMAGNQFATSTNITINGGSFFAQTSQSSGSTNTSYTVQNFTMTGGGIGTISGNGATTTINGALTVSNATFRPHGSKQVTNVAGLTTLSNNGLISVTAATSTNNTFETTTSLNGGLAITNLETGAYTPITISAGAAANTNGGLLVLGGDLTFTGNGTNTNTTTIAAPTGTGNQGAIALNGTRGFTIGDGAASVDLTVNAPFINGASAGGLTKTGNGALALSGASTFTGGTTVSAGTLLVNNTSGSGTGTGAVTVEGGILGGSGTISGAVTVKSGATLAPGNSPGLLTVGSLILESGSTTAFEIAGIATRGTDYDAITVTTGSALTLAGAFTINFTNIIALDNATNINLFGYTGTHSGDFSSLVSTGFYAGTWSRSGETLSLVSGGQTLTFSEVTGNLTVVPEPSTWALLAFSLTTVLVLRRRRA